MKFKYKLLNLIKSLISSEIYFDDSLYDKYKINYFDIGSIGNLKWPIDKIRKNYINIIKFDAQYDVLENNFSDKFNNVLWSSEEVKDFYINKFLETSSLFKPNYNVINNYPEAERFKVEFIKKIKTTTLDKIFDKNLNCDFLKMDVQGSELEILKGAENLLINELVGIEIEVAFAELYVNQPMFNEVDAYINLKFKLSLWDLSSQYFVFKNIENRRSNIKGRIIWADALYLRPIEKIDEWLETFDKKKAKKKLLSLIGILTAYGYYDYIFTLLENFSLSKKYLSEEEIIKLRKMLKKNTNLFKIGILNNVFYFLFSILSNIFRPIHNKFSLSNSTLGTRKFLKYFFKQ